MVSIMEMMDTIDDVGRARRRRRKWSRAEKARIVAESRESGVSVSEVARRHDVNANLVFTWRRQARDDKAGDAPALVPVRIVAETAAPAALDAPRTEPGPSRQSPAAMMEIDLGDGRCVRVGRDVDAGALRRVLSALERR
jgi:transposase